MPKMKTKKIARKRYKLTKTGKLMHRAQGRRHLRRKKSASQKRRQDKPVELTNVRFARKIRQFLNY